MEVGRNRDVTDWGGGAEDLKFRHGDECEKGRFKRSDHNA